MWIYMKNLGNKGHIKQEKPSLKLRNDSNIKFKPTDKQILVALAIRGNSTGYELSKGSKKSGFSSIGSSVAILSALERLESKGLIIFQSEERGRKRKWYSLTIEGLLYTFSLPDFWKDSSNFEQISEIYDGILPLLLGNRDFLKKTFWNQFYIEQIQKWASFVLRETALKESILNKMDNNAVFLQMIKKSREGLSNDFKKQLPEYPEYSENYNKLNTNLEFRYTGWVFDILNIVNTEKIILSTTLNRLSVLKQDDKIKQYINACFQFMKEDYDIKMRRLLWWIKLWNEM